MKRDAGFTLIEVLIAMFIFALISAGTMTALTTSLRGKAQMDTRLETIETLATARALMSSDFSNLTARPARDAYGGMERYMLFGDGEVLVSFMRAGRPNPGGLETRSEFQRVSYIMDNGNLIRRAQLQTNPAPQSNSSDRILLSGISDIEVRFTTAEQTVSQIFLEPADIAKFPQIITIEAEFDNGDTLTQHFETRL